MNVSTNKNNYKRLWTQIKIIFTTIIIYAIIYYTIRTEFTGMDETSSFFDCFYFSLTTLSTGSYGDIAPKTNKARCLVMTQHTIIMLDIIGLAAGVL